MPRKDIYHTIFKSALEDDGWTVAYDPMTISFPDMDLFIDLGAEHFVGASKGKRKVAIEIKSFRRKDGISKFYEALGQILIYRLALKKLELGYETWLAVPVTARKTLFERLIIQEAIVQFKINLVIFDQLNKKIVRWEKY